MPELPEVERGRRLAESVARGRRIDWVECADDEIVFDGVDPGRWHDALVGKRVVEVCRRGKHIWFRLDTPPHPLFHFGMTGAFRLPEVADLPLAARPSPPPDEPWPPRFTKIHLGFAGGGELVMINPRRLGRILLRNDPPNEPPLSRLGFDPLLDPLPPAEFRHRVLARRTAIKAILLDQGFAAGVGNWIADEVLYQARIDPRRHGNQLTPREIERVRRRLIAIVRRAVEVDADKKRFPRNWLFHLRWGKDPEASTLDGNKIEFLQVAGRTTAWVPARQS